MITIVFFLHNRSTMHIMSPEDIPLYNILVIGPSQSGKSTFIEFVKRYADPKYNFNSGLTGTGNRSSTKEARMEVIASQLPIYKLYDNNYRRDDNDEDSTETREIDIDAALSHSNIKPFKNILARDCDDGLEVRQEMASSSEWARFRFIDTPGLEDTGGNDIQNLAKIFEALSKVDKFHLVLIVDSHYKTLTPTITEAFMTYFHVFKELDSLAMILHTHVPNINRHPSKSDIPLKLRERSEFFDNIAGRKIQTRWIDCDKEEHGPANICLTHNTIREVLEIATIKTPVSRRKTFVRRPLKMATVDDVLRRQYQEKFDSVQKLCRNLGEIDQLSIEIGMTERKVSNLDKLVKTYDTDDLITLFEYYLDESWTYFSEADHHELDFREQEFTIAKKAEVKRMMSPLFREDGSSPEEGGEGFKFWKFKFRRQSFRTGYYYVVLSTTSREKYQKHIAFLKERIGSYNNDLKNQRQKMTNLKGDVQRNTENTSEPTEQLKFKLGMYSVILNHLKSDTLPMGLFVELANTDIYQKPSDFESVMALKSYLETLFGENPEILLQASEEEHLAALV